MMNFLPMHFMNNVLAADLLDRQFSVNLEWERAGSGCANAQINSFVRRR